ncbi:MAG: orotate phosphoribosyltransferase [Chloroflexota bacterium]|nr:orotate phosphoribosyltransferase [Chloroflexota bacterium]
MPASPEELQQLKAAIERHCITIHDEPVRLNSGGLSNYYCDLKGVTLHPVYARTIGRLMAPAVLDSGAEAVGGLVAGCIPIADAVARAALDDGRILPTFFGRAEAKDHGPQAIASMRAAATEDGTPLIRPGRKVAIVEDAVTQGGAAMQATKAAQSAGCEVVLVMTVVERHEGGGARFREIGIPFQRLFYTHEDGSLHVDEAVIAAMA